MDLDFSKLSNISKRKPQPQKPLERPVTEETEISLETLQKLFKQPTEATTEPQEDLLGDRARVRLKREQDDHNRTQAVYREYQKNIKSSEQLRTDILKGAQAGEPATALLLKAVECISLMTGDKPFYSQIEKDLTSVYGEALLEPVPLRRELEAVNTRLDLLRKALQRESSGSDRQRVQTAIKAHEKKVWELEKLLEKAS